MNANCPIEVKPVREVDSHDFDFLCRRLSELNKSTSDGWPADQLDAFRQAEVYRWFTDEAAGGLDWSNRDLTLAYLKLAESCLSSTFILTQRIAALKRIALSKNDLLRESKLPLFLTGQQTATVGISHLTTSRRHVAQPVMSFQTTEDGILLNGFCPWVTGANDTAGVVVGAEDSNGRQVLAFASTSATGLSVESGFDLIALTNTHTGPVRLQNVHVPYDDVLAGPVENVLSTMGTHSTGSFQTSALALGLAASAIGFLENESASRTDLEEGAGSLRLQHDRLASTLLEAASGNPVCTNEEIRTDANSLVLRATQAAMVAAKGAGFVQGHPVGRWCQEAMFFLVWSCPQAVRDANLCELAGV
ncbi:MAG: acyl-CoA dehydrogenase family protein [Planctomycetota bacterium]